MAVSKQQGPIRIKTLRKSVSASLPEKENAQSRFVSIKDVSPTTPVLCLETRPIQSGERCPTIDLGQSVPYACPPYCFILQALKKKSYDQTEKMLLLTQLGSLKSGFPRPSPPLLEMFIVSPLLLPKNTSLINPQGDSLSSNCKQNIATSGVDSIRERLLKKGVSETAA